MNVDFGRNVNDEIGMNPSRHIGSPHPHITRTRMRNCDIFDSVRRPLDIIYRGLVWHGTMKRETDNLRCNKIFENAKPENNSEAEKVGHKIL